LKDSLAIYEKHLLKEALRKSLSIRKTASLLNVSHVTLLNKLKKHDIVAVKKRTTGNIFYHQCDSLLIRFNSYGCKGTIQIYGKFIYHMDL